MVVGINQTWRNQTALCVYHLAVLSWQTNAHGSYHAIPQQQIA
jgi:hypothetical protein